MAVSSAVESGHVTGCVISNISIISLGIMNYSANHHANKEQESNTHTHKHTHANSALSCHSTPDVIM